MDEEGTEPPPPVASVPVVLATGQAVTDAVDGALVGTDLGWLPPGTSRVAILGASMASADWRETMSHPLTGELQRVVSGAELNVLPPPPLIGAGTWGGDRSRWTEVDLGPAASRRAVLALSSAVSARARFLVCGLPGSRAAGNPRPIHSLVAYAHPRQRLANRLAPPKSGAAAEIALALRPHFVLLVGKYQGRPLAVGTPNVVAAELVWLALAALDGAQPDASPGPWEDPVVQRSTELGLGLRLPHQIELRSRSSDPGPSSFLHCLEDHLELSLGIPPV